MGERFLILEETADALDVIDPELAVQFRVVNGLPQQPRDELAEKPAAPELPPSVSPSMHHEIRMDVGNQQIHCDCTCGSWSSAVDWDEIDTMVVQIREHLGSVHAGSVHATSEQGIMATAAPVSPTVSEKRVG